MMKGKKAESIDSLPYKMEMQKKGVTVPPADVPRPMTATPTTKRQTGLDATDCSHPFLKSRPHI